MSKRELMRLSISIVLAILAFIDLVYIGMGTPTYLDGEISRGTIDRFFDYYIDSYTLIALGGLLLLASISWLILPKIDWRRLFRSPVIVGALVIGVVLTFASLIIPFPQDYPGCCEIGPSRERGLPLPVSVSTGDLGSHNAFPTPKYRPWVAVADVILWALVVIYILNVYGVTRVKNKVASNERIHT